MPSGGPWCVSKRLSSPFCLTAGLPSAADAQGFFAASYGNVFGGAAPATTGSYALAVGGGGAHGIGSELEFSDTRNFFQTSEGIKFGRVMTLMPSVFVSVPISRFKPYGIFGFGFIIQRTGDDDDGLFSTLSNEDIGYSAGGGVTFQVSRRFGVRGRFPALQGPPVGRAQLSADDVRGGPRGIGQLAIAHC